MNRETQFSPCRTYRYTLWRQWDKDNPTYAMFIGLNPSTADEVKDDPTIRRCIGFARAWGYGALCMTNAFAFRATKPDAMKAFSQPVGADNDKWIVEMSKNAGIVIAAWGEHGDYQGRAADVLRLVSRVHCLGATKHGHPKHPLYVRASTTPILFLQIP